MTSTFGSLAASVRSQIFMARPARNDRIGGSAARRVEGGRRGAKAIPTRTCVPTIGPAPRASRASRHTPHSDDRLSPLRGEKPDPVVAQHEARRAHRSRREKVSGGRRSAQVVCSSVPHSHVTARALVRLARSMGFQGQIRPCLLYTSDAADE